MTCATHCRLLKRQCASSLVSPPNTETRKRANHMPQPRPFAKSAKRMKRANELFSTKNTKMNRVNEVIRRTGWRRLIGCLKLQVIFRNRATHWRALLRKMTCKDMISYGFLPPCSWGLSQNRRKGWKGAILRSRRPSVSWIFAPKTFCLENQLFGLGATNSFGLGAPSF